MGAVRKSAPSGAKGTLARQGRAEPPYNFNKGFSHKDFACEGLVGKGSGWSNPFVSKTSIPLGSPF